MEQERDRHPCVSAVETEGWRGYVTYPAFPREPPLNASASRAFGTLGEVPGPPQSMQICRDIRTICQQGAVKYLEEGLLFLIHTKVSH